MAAAQIICFCSVLQVVFAMRVEDVSESAVESIREKQNSLKDKASDAIQHLWGKPKKKQKAKEDPSGLCHCMDQRKYDQVSWRDMKTYGERAQCLENCPKECSANSKAMTYTFFACADKYMNQVWECKCMDLRAKAEQLSLPLPKVYDEMFLRWNFKDEDQHFARTSDMETCANTCDKTCRDANPLDPAQMLQGVCAKPKLTMMQPEDYNASNIGGSGYNSHASPVDPGTAAEDRERPGSKVFTPALAALALFLGAISIGLCYLSRR